MALPWELPPCTDPPGGDIDFGLLTLPIGVVHVSEIGHWPRNPALIKDPVTGLWPGQKDPADIPNFLKRGHPDCVIK